MLILHGKASTLRGPWAQVELASDARLEEIVLHLVRWIRKRKEPAQILFPVASRDLGGIELLYPNILIRAKDLRELAGIRSVMGVQGLTLGANGAPLEIDEEFVRELIGKTERAAEGWSEGVKAGSFVRILLGKRRMLAGTVTRVTKGIADVSVDMTTRSLRVRIPVKALLLLSIPKKERRYYVGRSN